MRLAVLLLLASPLAGCISEPAPAIPPLPHTIGALRASELTAGNFYAFDHVGGDLEFALLGNQTVFDLYGPDDRRLGQFVLEDGRSTVTLRGVAAGQPVLIASVLNGTLDIRSGGRDVTGFVQLGLHRERQKLAERPGFLGGLVPIPPAPPITDIFDAPLDETFNFTLERAPNILDVIGRGTSSGLQVRLTTGEGPVFEAETDLASSDFLQLQPAPLRSVPGQFYGQNIRNGSFSAKLQAAEFEGVLLASAMSYSRAQPVLAANATLQAEPLRFSYATKLVDPPSILHVHPEARQLGFTMTPDIPGTAPLSRALAASLGVGLPQADMEPEAAAPVFAGVVVVWGPDDKKLATLPVPANGTVVLAIPPGGGDYVVWPAVGSIAAYADVTPSDFQPVPLQVDEVQPSVPGAVAGGSGRYGAENATVELPAGQEGVFFRVEADEAGTGPPLPPSPTPGCEPPGLIRLGQAGEDLGIWGGETAATTDNTQASLRIGDGPLYVLHDGFGEDGCRHTVLRVFYFVRAANG